MGQDRVVLLGGGLWGGFNEAVPTVTCELLLEKMEKNVVNAGYARIELAAREQLKFCVGNKFQRQGKRKF